MNANTVTNEPPKHSDVSGSTQSAPGQHDANLNRFRSVGRSFHGPIAQCDDRR
jgi:hypothetical protein